MRFLTPEHKACHLPLIEQGCTMLYMDEQSRDNHYLTVKEAAGYIGVSAQTLRRWDSAGKLKAVRHPASKYRYYKRSDLEPFRLEYMRGGAQRR